MTKNIRIFLADRLYDVSELLAEISHRTYILEQSVRPRSTQAEIRASMDAYFKHIKEHGFIGGAIDSVEAQAHLEAHKDFFG